VKVFVCVICVSVCVCVCDLILSWVGGWVVFWDENGWGTSGEERENRVGFAVGLLWVAMSFVVGLFVGGYGFCYGSCRGWLWILLWVW
jgi:hypothetical protein